MTTIHIPVILATRRAGSKSAQVAAYVTKELAKYSDNVTTELIRVEDFDTTKGFESVDGWDEILGRSDGMIVVTPEYNHSYPGEFKMLIDSGDTPSYRHKAVGICGVSGGDFGGTRAIEQVKLLLGKMGCLISSFTIHFGKVNDLFPEDSVEITDEKYAERLKNLFDNVSEIAQAFKK